MTAVRNSEWIWYSLDPSRSTEKHSVYDTNTYTIPVSFERLVNRSPKRSRSSSAEAAFRPGLGTSPSPISVWQRPAGRILSSDVPVRSRLDSCRDVRSAFNKCTISCDENGGVPLCSAVCAILVLSRLPDRLHACIACIVGNATAINAAILAVSIITSGQLTSHASSLSVGLSIRVLSHRTGSLHDSTTTASQARIHYCIQTAYLNLYIASLFVTCYVVLYYQVFMYNDFCKRFQVPNLLHQTSVSSCPLGTVPLGVSVPTSTCRRRVPTSTT